MPYILLLPVGLGLASPAVVGAAEDENVRGVEREGRPALRPWRPLLGVVFFLPRHALDRLILGGERTAGILADPEFIARVEDFFYLIDDRLAWYPRLQLASGVTPLVGANLSDQGEGPRGTTYGALHSDQTWELGGDVSHSWERGNAVWTASLVAAVHPDDDLVFYGIGPNPKNDLRSAFLETPAEDHGFYRQQRQHLRFTLAVRPHPWCRRAGRA